MNRPVKRREGFVLIGFVALKFLLQYSLISPEYDLQRDEYLYLDQANHLAWGYLSVPPFTSWISVIIQVLGNSEFWIRFFPALFGSLTIIIVCLTIKELGGNLFALALGATCVLFSALLRLNTLYQPNSFDVFAWVSFYFVVIKYINSQHPKWLFIGAAVFAFGFLNKYNIAFLVIGLLPAIIVTNERRMLAQPLLYAAIALGLILILPNLIWQYQNDFPVVTHMKELSERQLVNVDRLGFLKSQILFFSGSLVVIVSGLYALIFYGPFSKYRPFLWAFFFTLIVFLYFKAKDYYAIGLYPIYIAFGAVFLADVLQKGWQRYLVPVMILLPILVFIPMYKVAFPNRSPEYILEHADTYRDLGLLRWEDGKDHALPQDFADMLGWKELAQKVDSVYASVPDPGKTLVLCDNYGQAGAINYYTTKGISAVSFNADYVDWFNLEQEYQHLIRVKEADEFDAELEETSPFFQRAIVAGSIENTFAREYGTTIFAFLHAKIDIRERIRSEIEEVKRRH